MARNFFLYIAVFFSLAILIGSLVPMEKVGIPTFNFFDKILHSGAYAVLTLSWMLAFRKKLNSLNKILFLAIGIFIYGIIIEVLQGAVTTYRQADFKDMLANLLGIAIAVLVFYFFQKKTTE